MPFYHLWNKYLERFKPTTLSNQLSVNYDVDKKSWYKFGKCGDVRFITIHDYKTKQIVDTSGQLYELAKNCIKKGTRDSGSTGESIIKNLGLPVHGPQISPTTSSGITLTPEEETKHEEMRRSELYIRYVRETRLKHPDPNKIIQIQTELNRKYGSRVTGPEISKVAAQQQRNRQLQNRRRVR